MGIVTTPKLLLPPPWLDGVSVNQTLNASDHRVAMVFAATKSGTLDKFEFRTGSTVSLNPASVVRVSFRDVVGTTGEPSGVAAQYRDILGSAIAASSWISPGLMTDDGTDLGTKRVVTRGDILAIVIEYQTFNVGDDFDVHFSLGRSTAGQAQSADGFPYDLFQSGGSWSKVVAVGHPNLALLYADASYGRPLAPGHLGATTTVGYASTSVPDERGNRFAVTAPVRATGAWVAAFPLADAGDFEVVLIDTDTTTELEAVAVDGAQGSSNLQADPWFVPFSAPRELAVGTYRLTLRPTTANLVSLLYSDVDSAGILESVFNENFYGTSRTNLGAWTDQDTRFYHMGLVLDGIEEGAGGAGSPAVGVLSDRAFSRGMIT